jgi:hypothetical protein
VDVFTSDNQLVITAQKGKKQSTTKPVVKKPIIKIIPKPKASSFAIPKVLKKPVVIKPVVKKPVVKKPVVKKMVTKVASASLSDKLIKMLQQVILISHPSRLRSLMCQYIFGRKHQLDLRRSYQF